MSESEAKKSAGGGTLTRSKTVTIRLDPKLRYLTEIGARSQRRTVSSFIEWAIENSLKDVQLNAGGGLLEPTTIALAEQADLLWNVHDSSRFAYLALLHGELLVHREQRLWQLIWDRGLLRDVFPENPDLHEDTADLVNWKQFENFVLPTLRKHWDHFNEVIDGKRSEESLPEWPQ